MDSLVSVIIPAFNAEKYIKASIDSILMQTFKDFEIIVVDDGSTDNTKEILNPYIKKSLIRYIYRENRGPGAARNTGIRAARGKYICFLDADDVYLPLSIETRTRFLEEYPQAGMVFSDYCLQDPSDERSLTPRLSNDITFRKKIGLNPITKKHILLPKDSYQFILPTCYPHTSTTMLRKPLVAKIGLFRTDIFAAEDNDLWLRFIMNCPTGYVNKAGSIYKKYRGTLYKPSERFFEGSIIFLEDAIKQYSFDYQTLRLAKRKLYYNYFSLGYCLFDKREYKRARGHFLRGIKREGKWMAGIVFFSVTLLPKLFIELLRDFKRRITL